MILLLFGYIGKVQKLSAEAHRVLSETCIAFFFPLRGVCVVFRRRKAEQTVLSNFYTPCDSLRIRANRTWLIAKTARCARSFCDGIAPILLVREKSFPAPFIRAVQSACTGMKQAMISTMFCQARAKRFATEKKNL